MKSVPIAAFVMFFALTGAGYAQESESGAPDSGPRQSGAPTGSGIKSDAVQAKEGIKSTAGDAKSGIKHGVKTGFREVKEGVKSGARQFKRGVAVAQCNNGEYSYTHHKTCNHNGGVREQLR